MKLLGADTADNRSELPSMANIHLLTWKSGGSLDNCLSIMGDWDIAEEALWDVEVTFNG